MPSAKRNAAVPDLEQKVRSIVERCGGKAVRADLADTGDVCWWVLQDIDPSEDERTVLVDLGFKASGGRWTRKDLALDPKGLILTSEEGERALRLLLNLTVGNGCSFAGSRRFMGGTCGQETGKGWDCFLCSARAFLRSVGVDPEERRGRDFG